MAVAFPRSSATFHDDQGCTPKRSGGPIVTLSVLLATIGGLTFTALANRPTVWLALCTASIVLASLALLSRPWTRFFQALLILGISINLDKTFNHSGYVGGVAGLSVSLVDVGLVVLLASSALSHSITRKSHGRLFGETTCPVLLLLGLMALSATVARDVSLSAYRLVDMAKLLVLYLLVANSVRSKNDIRFVTRCLFLGILVQAAVATLQYTQLFPPALEAALGFKSNRVIELGLSAPELVRPSGTIGHPNTLGAFLAMTLPTAVSHLLLPMPSTQKVLPALTLAAGTAALVTTFSRGAWASFVVATILLILLAGPRSRHLRLPHAKWILVAVLIVGSVTFVFANAVGTRLLDADQGATENRMRLNRLAIRMIAANPWLGVGLHNFGVVMHEYDAEHIEPQSIVHNVYLLVAAESGIVALVVLAWVFIKIAQAGVQGLRRDEPTVSLTAAGMLGGLVGFWLQLGVEVLVSGPPVQIFWLFSGVLVGMTAKRPDTVRWQATPDTLIPRVNAPTSTSAPSQPRRRGFFLAEELIAVLPPRSDQHLAP